MAYIAAFQKIAAFKIKFKLESKSQRLLAFLVRWYIPTYLTHYTTIIGNSIFFPSKATLNSPTSRFVIAHEVVHLMDQKRMSTPIFLLLYLSPQIFTLGILSFPWLGFQALWFLIFALPWPSPGRLWLEARAFGLEMYLYSKCGYKIYPDRYIEIFQSSGYYFMSWSSKWSAKLLTKYFDIASEGKDIVFNKVTSTFDECVVQESKQLNEDFNG